MLDLLKIEYKKIIPYTTFWVIFGLFFLFTPIVFYGVGQFKIEGFPLDFATVYNFPNVWNNLTYIASYFNLLIGMLFVILVCNEFAFKTFRQQVIDGQSKADFIVSKILLMTSFALITSAYVFVVGMLFGLTTGGGSIFEDIKYLLIYFIQSLGYMSVGLIIAVLIRSSAMSIITFICSILAESIIRFLVPDFIDQYFPMKIISNLTPFPTPEGLMMEQMQGAVMPPEAMSLNTTVIIAVVYVFVFWGISYFILTKKDIK